MALAAGQIIELTIERPVAGGRMLARLDGQVVLVLGALPGERVRAVVTKASRQVVLARTAGVIEQSPDRRAPPCDPACGGMLYAYVEYEAQRRLKSAVILDAFRRLGHLSLDGTPEVVPSPETGYRMRARLHVRSGRPGFFEEGTHTLCDATPTGQLLPSSVPAVASVLEALGEGAHACHRLIVAENATATDRVVHIEVHHGADLRGVSLDAAALDGVSGVSITAGLRTIQLAGSTTVTDAAAGWLTGFRDEDRPVAWSRQATSFFQGNRYLTPALLAHVLDQAGGDRVVDLYAGVGLYAVPLAARGATVTAVEGDRSGAADLVANARPWEPRLHVQRMPVEAFLRARSGPPPDVAVVNPPRSGVSAEAVRGLVGWGARRIVYVSCDPATLARDAARAAAGGYGLRSVRAFDLFPGTPHVETVAVFER